MARKKSTNGPWTDISREKNFDMYYLLKEMEQFPELTMECKNAIIKINS